MKHAVIVNTSSKLRTNKVSLKSLFDSWELYLMMVPGLLWYIVLKYVPIYGLIIAIKDFDLMKGIVASPMASPWYKHFETFFQSQYFEQLLTNTLLISTYKIVFGMLPPIILALLLNECRKMWFKRIVQTLSYMPHFLSWVIIYGIMYALLSETSGLLNMWLKDAGLEVIPFLRSESLFRSLLVASEVWQNLGWGAIIYLAAITGINPEQYEAARIDGAGRLKQIWYVTIPGITQIIVMMLIIKLGHVMDAGFEQIFIMYNAQVYSVADIIDTWVYRTGLETMNYSLATAVGMFKSVIGFVLVLSANKIARKWGDGGIW